MTLGKKIALGMGVAVVVILLITVGIRTLELIPKVKESYVTPLVVVQDLLPVTGIALREEETIPGEINGMVDYHYGNGVKVPKGTSVATVYTSEADIVNEQKIQSLTEEYEMLADLSAHDSGNAGYSGIAQRVYQKMGGLALDVNRQSMGGISTYKNGIIELFTSKSLAGGAISPQTRMTEIQAEIEQIKGKISANKTDIMAPNAGYFVNSVDGYENFATLDAIKTWNAADLESILESPAPTISEKGIAGKIVLNYDWFFVALIPNKEVDRIKEQALSGRMNGQDWVTFHLSFNQTMTVKAMLYTTLSRPGEENSIMIFQCSDMNEDLATLRKKTVDIVFGEYRGLRVPTSAIRFDEEQKPYVYITIGNDVKTREIDVIYEEEDSVISSIHDATALDMRKYLQVDDIIMVNGEKYG